ncbi:hypothetical protein P4L01_27460, partial [Bacillus cereus]|nr:hypothetical protein [Bacillus cereus]
VDGHGVFAPFNQSFDICLPSLVLLSLAPPHNQFEQTKGEPTFLASPPCLFLMLLHSFLRN